MRNLRPLLLLLALTLAPGCVVAGSVPVAGYGYSSYQPVGGYGYGYGYAAPRYYAPAPRYYAPPRYVAPRYYAPPVRHHYAPPPRWQHRPHWTGNQRRHDDRRGGYGRRDHGRRG